VSAVDVLADSTILVLSGGRLERYDAHGRWLGGSNLLDAGIRPLRVAVACGTDVFVYGPPLSVVGTETGRSPWVYHVDLESPDPSVRAILTIEGPPWPGWAGLIGFSGTPDGILLWHDFGERPTGFWIPCDGEVSMWSVGSNERPAGGTPDGSVLTLPDTLFAGAVSLGPLKVWARRGRAPADGRSATRLHGVEDGTCWEAELAGTWVVLDAHDRGLMVTTREPFPVVQVLDWEWLLRQRREAPCRVPDGDSPHGARRTPGQVGVRATPSMNRAAG
jgi:hypothetical protein